MKGSDALWPTDIAPYKRTGEFTETTVPAALQRSHSTKAGVWAKLHVIQGELDFHDLEEGRKTSLRTGVHPLIFPEQLHHVEVRGPVRFFVEFYARPSTDSDTMEPRTTERAGHSK